jgi:hypothetical protein
VLICLASKIILVGTRQKLTALLQYTEFNVDVGYAAQCACIISNY